MAGDGDVRDELPEDLNAVEFVGVYRFPDNKRRRIPAAIYLVFGLIAIGLWATASDDAVLINDGLAIAGAGLIVIALYMMVAGWPMQLDEKQALEIANASVSFPVGHASAQLGWRGLLSVPTWRILLYSAEEPPANRGLFMVDARHGNIVEHFVEENPEDWSELL